MKISCHVFSLFYQLMILGKYQFKIATFFSYFCRLKVATFRWHLPIYYITGFSNDSANDLITSSTFCVCGDGSPFSPGGSM